MTERVLVTGAGGYVGAEVVHRFLRSGFRVRAVVRTDPAEKRYDFLRGMPGAARLLEVVGGDLRNPGVWSLLIPGCRWICHSAAAVRLRAADPGEDIFRPTMDLTRSFCNALEQARGVEAVCHVSSMATVVTERPRPGYTFSEEDWNDESTVETNAYAAAKVASERMTMERIGGRRSPRLSVINPAFVLGPLRSAAHVSSSPALVRHICEDRFLGSPDLNFSIVDVRDVAEGAFRSLTRNKRGRYLLSGGNLWMPEMSEMVRTAFPSSGVCIRRVPAWVMYLAAPFHPYLSIRFLKNNLGRESALDTSRMNRVLGIRPQPVCKTVLDTVASLNVLGLLRSRSWRRQ